MSLWKANEAAGATQGTLHGDAWEAQRVVIDSRSIASGDLFVALRGERFDGHDFLTAAAEKGAYAAMVERGAQSAPLPALEVADCYAGLEALARKARQRTQAKIAGITGSVGKTSAKEALALALGAQGRVHMTRGNLNNHIGVPLTLANLPQECDYAVIEMGMNHAGEITPLSRLSRPHAALITAVEAVHIEFFSGLDGIAAAKSEISAGMEPSGVLVLPADSPLLGLMQKLAKEQYGITDIRTFGTCEYADYRLVNTHMEGLGMTVEAHIGGIPMEYRLGAYGEHWATMSVGVLGMVDALRADVRAAAESLQRFHEPEGRGRIQKISLQNGDAYLIDDSYNASPVSMKAAFAKLAGVQQGLSPEGRKVAILGDMLELGTEAPAYHAQLVEALETAGVHLVCVAGSLMCHLWDALPAPMRGVYTETAQELLLQIPRYLKPDDTILVKGSHGSHIHIVAQALKTPAHAKQEE